MGVHTIYDSESGRAAMYCSTAEWAFGPVFRDEDASEVPDDCEMLDARQLCDLFQEWLCHDARKVDHKNLGKAYGLFMKARRNGMYPKLCGEGCACCGRDIGHHDNCTEKT